MLSRLFRRKPKLTDADAARRREAVLALDASEQAAFLGVAREDPDPAVRAAAIARIASAETLGAMLDEPPPPGGGDHVWKGCAGINSRRKKNAHTANIVSIAQPTMGSDARLRNPTATAAV